MIDFKSKSAGTAGNGVEKKATGADKKRAIAILRKHLFSSDSGLSEAAFRHKYSNTVELIEGAKKKVDIDKVLNSATAPGVIVNDEASVLNGKTKPGAVKYLYEMVNRKFSGTFDDPLWSRVQWFFKELHKRGVDYSFISVFCSKDPGGSVRKRTWRVSFQFVDNMGRGQNISGEVIAIGKGSMDDPMGSYSLVFTTK